MEVEKLDIDAGPVDQIGSSSVLARRPIVGKPSPTRKLTMSLENQQLVWAEVLLAMQKVRRENQYEGQKGLNACCYVLNGTLKLLGARGQH